MRKKMLVPCLAAVALASIYLAQAQQAKVYRVGVIHEGGHTTRQLMDSKKGSRSWDL
jgi:hypothetical protein